MTPDDLDALRANGVWHRFWAKVVWDDSGCWLWTAAMGLEGYGTVRLDGRMFRAHRVAWEWLRGPIPEGLTIDHLCRVRHCVNPEHLEVVTARENTLRGQGITAQRARQTHCKHGHEFTPENIYRRRDRPHSRICRECDRTRRRPVMATENRKRAAPYLPSEERHWKGRNTHCAKGHPWNAENTYRTKEGFRSCRVCKREWWRKNRAADVLGASDA